MPKTRLQRPITPEHAPTLEDQLKLCRAQNAYLHRELANALKLAPMAPQEGSSEDLLRLEIDTLRERFATLKLHYEQSQQDIAQLKHSLAVAHKVLGWQPDPSWLLSDDKVLDGMLLQLLTLAHPDKWSQGQLAVELAHELTITINHHRERATAH